VGKVDRAPADHVGCIVHALSDWYLRGCWDWDWKCLSKGNSFHRWALWEWLGHESSNRVNEQIHCWIHSLMAYWEVVET
jgi:hypothetical protein